MKESALDVLYQSDNNYAVVTGVSIASLLENNQDIKEINIYLIDGGITESNLLSIRQIVERYRRNLNIIDGKKVEKDLIEYNCRPYKGSYVTYYKLLTFGSLNVPSGKVLMLDGDILVLGSLKEIMKLDLNGYIMAEIVDPYMPRHLTRRIGIPNSQPYYNAGVMLINQKEWISRRCQRRIVDHWNQEKSDYLFADQDVTNVLFGDGIKELHIKYNFYSKNYMLQPYERLVMNINKEMLAEVRANGPVCVHCIDESWRSRPWFKGNTHSMTREWDKYLLMTPWAQWQKLDTKLNIYHRVDKVLYSLLPKLLYAVLLRSVSSLFALLSISKRMLDNKKMNVED